MVSRPAWHWSLTRVWLLGAISGLLAAVALSGAFGSPLWFLPLGFQLLLIVVVLAPVSARRARLRHPRGACFAAWALGAAVAASLRLVTADGARHEGVWFLFVFLLVLSYGGLRGEVWPMRRDDDE